MWLLFSKQLRTEQEFLSEKLYLRLSKLKKQALRKEKRKYHFCVGHVFQRLSVSGAFKTLFQELKEVRGQLYRYLRISPERFN